MGADEQIITRRKISESENNISKKVEDYLTKAGLGKNQIEKDTLEQLEQSLKTIETILQNPRDFGVWESETSVFGIKASVQGTALPILLERKRLILDRINLLKSQEKILTLKDLINKKITNNEDRVQLYKELEKLETEAINAQEKTNKIEVSLELQKFEREKENAKLEALERRSKVLLSFLERESAATIVGVILMIIITIAQILALFIKIPPSDILNNAFLLILGYFFGQTTNKVSSRDKQ